MFDSANESESEDYTFLEKYSDELYLKGEELFSVEDNNFKLVGVRCVAHTLQLAVQDAIRILNGRKLKVKSMTFRNSRNSRILLLRSHQPKFR